MKVVLISLAGSEGLDLKYIRQVHILDPWYNMNRIEQIIGRAVRTCSHKDLPFPKRNVELYLYGTLLANQREEAADLYVYRLAELKAVQIGNVSRTIKEIAVDCILNYQQGNFTVENMKQTVTLELASGGTLEYQIGDKPYSTICDYMKKCSYTCKQAPSKAIINEDMDIIDINNATYGEAFIMQNNDKIIYKIKMFMKDQFFYRKQKLVALLNAQKTYPLMQINAALNQLIEDKTDYITDKYGRLGNLVNIGDLYLFQPLELSNEHIGLLERSMPVEYKHDNISIDLANVVASEAALGASEAAAAVAPLAPLAVAPLAAAAAKPKISAKEKEKVKVKEKAKIIEEEVISPQSIKKITLLLNKMLINYKLALVPNKPKRGDENWYKFCSEVIDEMEKLGIQREILLDAMVAHICDELLFEDKMLLLNELPGLIDKHKDEFVNRIERYLFNGVFINKGLTGIFVQNKGDNQLYVKRKGEETWSLAEAEDKHDLEGQITERKNQLLPVKDKLHSVVGFMMNFKKEENNIVFKLKVFKLKGVIKKRNKGARCYGKSIEMMSEIMGEETLQLYLDLIHEKYKDIIDEKKKNRLLNKTDTGVPDELEAINHIHACVVQEMFLRTYNTENKNGRHWFLTPEEAVLIDLENRHFAVLYTK